jgi:hypothetical protein
MERFVKYYVQAEISIMTLPLVALTCSCRHIGYTAQGCYFISFSCYWYLIVQADGSFEFSSLGLEKLKCDAAMSSKELIGL